MFEGDLQRALEYVLQAGLVGIRVGAVNISYQLSDQGLPNPQAYSTVCTGSLAPFFDQLNNFGIVSVAAAGNIFAATPNLGVHPAYYGGVDNPACYASVIAVGATTDTTDAVAINLTTSGLYFSTQSGPLIDFWAPGAPIQTPVDVNVHYGTSFSAPHVAAVWTRLRARYPSLTNAQLRAKLASCPLRTDPRNGKSAPRICWKSIWN